MRSVAKKKRTLALCLFSTVNFWLPRDPGAESRMPIYVMDRSHSDPSNQLPTGVVDPCLGPGSLQGNLPARTLDELRSRLPIQASVSYGVP